MRFAVVCLVFIMFALAFVSVQIYTNPATRSAVLQAIDAFRCWTGAWSTWTQCHILGNSCEGSHGIPYNPYELITTTCRPKDTSTLTEIAYDTLELFRKTFDRMQSPQ